MEIAKGTIRRNPHSADVKRDLTPAEVLLLHSIHFRNAQGSPLGDDFAVYGEAVTVEVPAKPAEDETFNQITGKTTPGRPAVPAKTHKRTNAEEVTRLKNKYNNARVRLPDGSEANAFTTVFGSAIMPKLPQTFDEIEEAVGVTFPPLKDAKPVASEAVAYRNELMGKGRAALVRMALDLKLKVDVADDTTTIVDNIIEASGETVAVTIKEAESLNDLTKAQLLEVAAKNNVPVDANATKAVIMAAIEAAKPATANA